MKKKDMTRKQLKVVMLVLAIFHGAVFLSAFIYYLFDRTYLETFLIAGVYLVPITVMLSGYYISMKL